MRIMLINLYSDKPNPSYAQIASELRIRGHSVWYGRKSDIGDLEWHDGVRIVKITRGPRAVPISLAALPVISPLLQRLLFFPFMLRLKNDVREHRPDVIQVNQSKIFIIWFLPLFMPFSTAFVIDWRQIDERPKRGSFGGVKYGFRRRLRRVYSMRTFDCATFLDEAGARQVMGKDWLKSAVVVPLGVGSHFLTYPTKLMPVDQTKVHFLYIGTLSRERKLELLLKAAKVVQNVTSSFQFDIIGPDTSDGFYQELVNELGIVASVRIKHPVLYDKVPNLVESYDVAVAYAPEFPADWQYHPTLKVLEYRAIGRPIIACDFDPNRQIVIPGQNGLLVKNTVSEIASAMLTFINDRQFLKRCSTNAIRMRMGLSWSTVAAMYERDVYAKIVAD